MNRNVLGATGGSSAVPASDVFARPPPSENVATTYYPSVDVELPEKRPLVVNPPPMMSAPAPPNTVVPSTRDSLEEASMSLDDLADAFLRDPNDTGPLMLDPLPAEVSDLERLKILVRQRAWRDALSYTKMFLERGSKSHYASLYEAIVVPIPAESSRSSSSSAIDLALDTHKQDLVYIMTMHMMAMVKLSLFSELAVEVERWTFCYHHTQPRRYYPWISWQFHIFAASTLQYGRFGSSTAEAVVSASQQHCLDALWAIREAIPDVEFDARVQVENMLHNVFIVMKDWRMALDCLQRIMDLAPNIARLEIPRLCRMVNVEESTLTVAYRLECLSRQGRIWLQIGGVDQARNSFQQSRTEWKVKSAASSSQDGSSVMFRFVTAQLSSNNGLLHFSQGEYEEALESFRTAIEELKAARHIPTGPRQPESDLLESRSSALYSESINNMALCALYTCRLSEAVQLMEALVRENVTAHLTERVTLNLCTLYELSMDSNAALRKKKVLQRIASRFLLQDIPAECFRVS